MTFFMKKFYGIVNFVFLNRDEKVFYYDYPWFLCLFSIQTLVLLSTIIYNFWCTGILIEYSCKDACANLKATWWVIIGCIGYWENTVNSIWNSINVENYSYNARVVGEQWGPSVKISTAVDGTDTSCNE